MSARAELSSLLAVPDSRLSMLDGIADSDLNDLAAAVQDAMDRQDRAVEEGVEKSLSAIPRPLRGRARSMIFPGGRG